MILILYDVFAELYIIYTLYVNTLVSRPFSMRPFAFSFADIFP